MPDLPKHKVGIVACSGEEMAEGTVTRLAALKVLEQLRPGDTVTICLPLFLAGGEGDRAFARFYPTIAVDGCPQRCAARATEQHSGRPAASLVVTDLIAEHHMARPRNSRSLDEAGQQAVAKTAERLAGLVDDLLNQGGWSRRSGTFVDPAPAATDAAEATCACGSGIPVKRLVIDGRSVTIVALPLLFEQFRAAGKTPCDETARALLEVVKIYNAVPAGDDETYAASLVREYAAFLQLPHEAMP